MQECINYPVNQPWTNQDIIMEYRRYHDKRKVARIYDISVKEVHLILKKAGEVQ